ncbi:hypothetical protein RSOLAG1IB_06261 [Rhizoctonia solani AG-1 IB]|uniref:CFEM domain-containing protein n=1 Tax=Thanatephorus cucumeris (strain AG1-IB / isolate 7/3/14) TaxID=1108050 RepID=A0A0B7F8Q9_THACB|nr:hypothetical protein RSOLAG1IB_06261 [Rhizoctonia solani AG-1 IB]
MFYRLSLLFVALMIFFAGIANAQFPSCAQPCLGQASPGSCSLTDNACLCRNAAYCNATNTCFKNSCSAADWKTAYDFSVALCRQAGVTQGNVLNPPTKRTIGLEARHNFVPVYVRRGH